MAKAQLYDAADYLDSPEVIAAYLNEALETGDDALIKKAIGAVGRTIGIDNTEFGEIMKALNARGVHFEARQPVAA